MTSTRPTITVEIAPDGSVKITTAGYRGRTCQDATRALERALGTVTSDTPTEDATRTTATVATQRTGGRS